MRVLVTGGTGYVGCHTVAALAGQGHQVRLLVRARDRIAPALEPLGVAGADAVVERFRRAARAVAGDADVRVASFPEQGLTDHALRAAVTRRPPAAGAFVRDEAASSNVGRGSLAAEALD